MPTVETHEQAMQRLREERASEVHPEPPDDEDLGEQEPGAIELGDDDGDGEDEPLTAADAEPKTEGGDLYVEIVSGHEFLSSDPSTGKLFDVPRVGVIVDETDPTILRLVFSGAVQLDRESADDVKFFNRLRAGHDAELHVIAHVVGAKQQHQRDKEGDISEVVQTKTLAVHSLTA